MNTYLFNVPDIVKIFVISVASIYIWNHFIAGKLDPSLKA